MTATNFVDLKILKSLLQKSLRVHWISEPNVWSAHKTRLTDIFGSMTPFLIKSGEEAKSLNELEKTLNYLIDQKIKRSDVIVGIGGGALTDHVGLTAALTLRGVTHHVVPTTLLAQIDAAVGGKTAVNLKGGKNLCGTFKWPQSVCLDHQFLETLPKEEWQSGFGEALKTAFIEGDDLFQQVLSTDHFDNTLIQCLASVKDQIVQEDPFEKGPRMFLNFGHTAGHAFESLGLGSHGVCILWGIRLALSLSSQLLGSSDNLLTQVDDCLVRHKIPLVPEKFEWGPFCDYLSVDKKRQQQLVWILAKRPGEMVLSENVSLDLVKESLQKLGFNISF